MRAPTRDGPRQPRHAETPVAPAQCVPPPMLVSGRIHCPRCAETLRFDGDEWFCLMCGYAYDAEAAAVHHRVHHEAMQLRPRQPVGGGVQRAA